MQTSDQPTLIPLPFASAGDRNAIPTASQIPITPGAASLTDGFPPKTSQRIADGGVPPDRADMNGVLYLLSLADRWAQAGGGYKYNAAFAAAIGGYPKGAMLLRSDFAGFWVCTADNNATDPDAGGTNWQSFSPARTGKIEISLDSTVPPTWIRGNDGTIGNAVSGATTRANADTQALYLLLWTQYSNTFAPVTGGRGASALADFNAGKPIQTGIIASRVIGGVGSGSGLTPRIAGDITGEESVTLAPLQMPPHRHLNGIANDVNSGNDEFVYDTTNIDVPGNATQGLVEGGSVSRQGTTSSIVDNASGTVIPPRTANALPHDNMSPTVFLNVYIKL